MSGDGVFVATDSVFGLGAGTLVNTYSGATPLGQVTTNVGDTLSITNIIGEPLSTWEAFLGLIPGSVGETSTLFILLGGAILLFTGVASWRIMLSVFAGGLAMGALAHAFASPLYPASLLSPIEQICYGGFAFAAVFMAAGPVTGARSNVGKYIYGFLIGVFAVLIRTYNGGYPEGAMLAVLLMNAFAPTIDYCVVNANINRRLKRAKA
jgi:Na+-transporting NADH:ubiquinone oxidoreductase subunit B